MDTTHEQTNQKYKKKQGASNEEGIALQITVLVHLLWNALLKHKCGNVKSFQFANNVEVKRFACVGLKYVYESSSQIIVLHTKHTKDSVNVTVTYAPDHYEQFSSQQNRNYNVIHLLKTFFLYQTLKKSPSLLFDSNTFDIKFMFFTNASIKVDDYTIEDVFETVNGNELQMFNSNEEYCFTFKKDSPFVEDFYNSFTKDIPQRDEIIDFLSRVIFLTKQPNLHQLKSEIKVRLQNEFKLDEQDKSFSLMENKMRNWWQNGHVYLDQSNTFIQDSFKVNFHFNVSLSDKYFTGRNEEFNTIENLHFSNANWNILAVCGLGGNGKTALVKEYIKRNSHLYNHNIIWINAAQLQQSFKNLASELHIDCSGDDVIQQIYDYFIQRKCLIVIDNVESQPQITSVMLPLNFIENQPYFIMTSRNREWDHSIKIIRLNVLKVEEAKEFVYTALEITFPSFQKEVDYLLDMLKCYPLVLRQATSYIKYKTRDTGKSISDFINNYKKIEPEVLHFTSDENEVSTATTWNVTVNEIKNMENGELALEILNIMAYMASTNIQKKMFLKLENESEKISFAIKLLVKYSMIEWDGIAYSVHEMVQKVFRMQNQKEENTLEKCLSLFGTIDRYIVDHAMIAWRHAAKYKHLVQQYSYLTHLIVEVLFNESRFSDGYEFGQECLGAFHQHAIFIPTNEDIIKIRKICAKILFRLCDYKKSLEEYKDVMIVQIEKYGEMTEEVFNTKNSIALILRHQGYYDEALQMLKTLLVEEENTLGAGNCITLMTKDEIATIYKHHGRYKEALEIYLQIIDLREKQSTELDDAALTTMDNIGCTYNYLGMFKESEKAFNTVLNIKMSRLSENDPSVSRTRNNLGVLFLRWGRLDDAMSILQQRLEKLNKSYKKPSSAVITTTYNISLIYFYKGNYETALTMCEENLRNSIQLFTKKHKTTFQIFQLKADILFKQGHCSEAKNMFEDILKIAKEVFKGETLETLQSQNSVGCIKLAQGQIQEAMEIFQNILTKKQKLLGENHPEVLVTEHCIGLVYEKQGKSIKALKLFEEVHEKRVACLGKDHFRTIESMNHICMTKKSITSLQQFFEDNKLFLLFTLLAISATIISSLWSNY